MTDGRVYAFGYGVVESDIIECLKQIKWNSVARALELVIHPSTKIVKDIFGAVTEKRVHEYTVFKNPSLLTAFRDIGIEPVGFEVLKIKTVKA